MVQFHLCNFQTSLPQHKWVRCQKMFHRIRGACTGEAELADDNVKAWQWTTNDLTILLFCHCNPEIQLILLSAVSRETRGIETWCSKNVKWWGSETTKGGRGGGGRGGRRFTKTIPLRHVQKWNFNWVFPPSSSSEGSHAGKNWLRITNVMMSFLTRPPNSNTDNQVQTNFNQTPAKLDLFSCGGSSARNFVAKAPNGWWTPEEALMLSNALMKPRWRCCVNDA